MRKGIVLAIGGLALLAGCGNQGDKAANVPDKPKVQAPPYQIAFDARPAKANPAGVTIPAIKYTTNPKVQENRATLVVRIDTSGVTKEGGVADQIIMIPTDIPGLEGTLPADYMDKVNRGLATLLGTNCMKGKVKITVALARSSLNPQARGAQVDAKRLSDWLPIEVVFKNPHPAC